MTSRKIFAFFAVLAAFSALIYTAGSARAGESLSSFKLDTQLREDVSLNSVVMSEDRSVTFRGYAADPVDGCLPVRILIDGERGAWWPVYRCVMADQSGEWMVRVPFDDEGTPISIHFQISE